MKDINYRFEAHRLLTELYLSTEDSKNAEKEINQLINLFPNYSGVDKLLYNFSIYLNEKKDKSTFKYFNILQLRYPDSNYALMLNVIYGNKYFEAKNYNKAISYYEKFLNSNIEESRGIAYFNILKSYFYLQQYEKVISLIKNVRIPPLDENQWRELPLLHARACYKISRYDEVYNILKWEEIKTFNDEDAKMLIESTIKTGDVEAAANFIDRIKERNQFHGEQLLILGSYYQTKKNYIKAEEVYSTLLLSETSENIKEKARIELAIIKMENDDFDLSINYLNQVEMNENIPERDSLIIINHFNIGKDKIASDITDSRIKYLLKNRFTEKVLLLNLEYSLKNKNINSFLRYSTYLKPFKENENYLDYLTGFLFYNTGDYKRSFNYFYKLSLKESEYKMESNYYLGRLSLLNNKNKINALKYFLKAIETESENDYYYKSKIEAAIIYYEMKNIENSLNFLNNIIKSGASSKYKNEAENLLEYFSFTNSTVGGKDS